MKPIKNFEDFIKNGTVKKQSPDISRAESLVKDSEREYYFLAEIIKKIGIDDKNANTIIKVSYDIIMDLIRAKMLEKGFNATGIGAHEAEVSYLRELGFGENDVQFADQLRYFRNRIMYYGKILDKEYAEKVLGFMNKTYPRLRQMLKY